MSANAHAEDREVHEARVDRDEAVVARVLGGDREAFRVLVRRYQEGLFRYALGMVGNADAAADVVQDSFIKAYVRLSHCRNPEHFGGWVTRIVRNACLDYLKDRRRAVVPLHAVAEMESNGDPLDRLLEQEDVRAAVFAALERLPADQREAFLMKHLEDRSYEEMTEVLGASISALKMRVKRARETLQRLLAGTAL